MAGYRRPVSEAERAAAAEARQATLDKLHAQLSDGILALNDPQAWQAWLKFSSQFHRYSFGNSLLIMLQDPQATHVAGYQAFKAMGRQVRRGETGIKVLAPITRREPRLDDAGQPVRDDQGRVLHRTHVVATKPVTVFDIRQTDGPPLPDPKIGEATLLTGQAPAGLWDRLQGLLEERGFDVRRGADLGGPNGYTDFGQRLVMVRDDVDDAQAVKTLAHEAGHVLLHQDQGGRDCRGILEVEAESVAYMVTNAHGLDSSQYTFNYVAGWALNAVTEAARPGRHPPQHRPTRHRRGRPHPPSHAADAHHHRRSARRPGGGGSNPGRPDQLGSRACRRRATPAGVTSKSRGRRALLGSLTQSPSTDTPTRLPSRHREETGHVAPHLAHLGSTRARMAVIAAGGRRVRRECRHAAATHRLREAPGVTVRREAHPSPRRGSRQAVPAHPHGR